MSTPPSSRPPVRRRFMALALAAAAGLATGCSGAFGPHTVELSQARLQELVARRFPIDKRVLDAVDLTLDSPRVSLQPDANRIAIDLDLRAAGGGAVSARLGGQLRVSEALRFEPSDNTIRLVDVRVERFEIEGLPHSWQRQVDKLGKPFARSLLEGQVLYTLRPKDIAGLEGHGLRPAELRVTASGLEITLVPVTR